MRKFALLLTICLFIACAIPGCVEESKPKEGVVRIGYITSDLHQLAYAVAKNASAGGGKSMYAKQGLKIVDPYSGLANGGLVMDRFADGSIDIGFLGAPPAITKHLNLGTNVKIIAQANEIGSAIVVKNGINSTEDLKGKTLATPGHSTIQYFLLKSYLESNGLKEGNGNDDVRIIDVPVGLLKSKLDTGDIVGFAAWEPFCADAVSSGGCKILVYSSDVWANHLCCVVAVHGNYAKSHSSEVTKFLKAHIEATKWMNEALADNTSYNYTLLVKIATEFTGKNESVIRDALANIRYKYTIDDSFRSSFKNYTEKLIAMNLTYNNLISERGYSSIDDFTNKYIDDKFLARAEK
ncbi:MAG: ABC transporter substrate-binding protein [Thermoplasmata archaeon]